MAGNRRKFSPRIKAALALNLLVILLGFIFAFNYIRSPELTAYHLRAMGVVDWASLDPAFRPMLTVFKRVAGIGMSTVSIALTIILLFGFGYKLNWSRWAFLILCFSHYMPLLGNQLYLEANTETASPYLITSIGMLMALAAFFLSRGMAPSEADSSARRFGKI